MNRRQALGAIGTAGLGVVAAACSSGSSDDGAAATTSTTGPSSGADGSTAAPSSTSAPAGAGSTTVPAGGTVSAEVAALFDQAGTCRVTPEEMEGPYWFDVDSVRRDIREDREGTPLRLGLRVQDAACAPISDAVVEIWHCDALGSYSGFESASASANAPQNLRGAAGAGTQAGPGGTGGGGAGGGGAARTDDETYLRGAQVTDANGVVEFLTVYPGWYTGRAVHVHLKVHLGGTTALTSQLYFPDDVNDRAHAMAPYAAHTGSRTTNDVDLIFHADNQSAVAETTEGWAAALTIGLTT
ncbi:MAG TPA: intradiol ring-cleavage dioxygenase [Acidimicrobiales bacterium]|nr:intradiol ring-cleavage dioxygenase [Acidimicrobiales bacterium]HRA33784.1 intradiol ring-cleavage dioxygenase [Acidimicrobiales bacterium]